MVSCHWGAICGSERQDMVPHAVFAGVAFVAPRQMGGDVQEHLLGRERSGEDPAPVRGGGLAFP